MVQAGFRPTVGLLGLVLAFVFALRLLKVMKTVPLGPPEGKTLPPTGDDDELPPSASARGVGDGTPPRSRRGQAGRVELTDPNLTARVVKAWLSED
jgi:hypothetical protein